jgi:hypothetical protein
MAGNIDDIQARYISELRATAPSIRDWWADLLASEGEERAWKRWPTGLSGHPRILAIFRKYYFEIEEYNLHAQERLSSDPERTGEAMWGEDDEDEDLEYESHAERLIHNVLDDAPDLEDVVDGICFVPVGMEPNEEPV